MINEMALIILLQKKAERLQQPDVKPQECGNSQKVAEPADKDPLDPDPAKLFSFAGSEFLFIPIYIN